MPNKLTIIISGKENSGKKSIIKLIFAEYLNRKLGTDRFSVEKYGKDIFILDKLNNYQSINPFSINNGLSSYPIKLYDFENSAKDFCIETFGLEYENCYGDNDDGRVETHISWDNIPKEIREKYGKKTKGCRSVKLPKGNIRTAELINIFKNDICRSIDENCWARSLYKKIEKDGVELAIVNNAKYPSEITIGTEMGFKAIRMLKNVNSNEYAENSTLDNLALGEYSLAIDNEDMSIKQMWQFAHPHIVGWFKKYGVI